jgi:beta-1,4-N-acetylglucosaminyltransferase
MKVCLVCSHGGHLTETLQLMQAFEGYDIFFATYHGPRDSFVESLAPAYFTENIGTNIWRMCKAFFWAFGILWRERPDAVLSLGAEIAVPFIYLSKLMRVRTLYIESWCRVEDLSLTGKLVYPVADAFWVQWPQLKDACGSKAEFRGAVI